MSSTLETTHLSEQPLLFEADIPRPRSSVESLSEVYPMAVSLDDRANYLKESLDEVEQAYLLAGNIKKHRRTPTRASAKALAGSRVHLVEHMKVAKELFARGAGYTALRNLDGTYPQEVQDDLDLDFIRFKIDYAGPGKENARSDFKAGQHRSYN